MRNPKARYEYHFLAEFIAGIELFGSEVKSLRLGKANITEAWCHVVNGEIFLRNAHISKYEESSYMNHDETRVRKLLLKKSEIQKIHKMARETGITIVPLEIFLKRGRYKIKIAVSKGKKDWDKRETIKKKDIARELVARD